MQIRPDEKSEQVLLNKLQDFKVTPSPLKKSEEFTEIHENSRKFTEIHEKIREFSQAFGNIAPY
jgi:hypothetical protein